MILQRLAEHYDRLVADPAVSDALPRRGFSRQKISFCVVLKPDGSLQQFQSQMEPDAKGKPRPRLLLVPGEAKPSGSGLNPGFLWDNTAYLLGWSGKDDPKARDRAPKAFESFRARHLALDETIKDPGFRAVCAFLRSWNPDLAEAHLEQLKEFSTGFGVFRIAGETQFIHEAPRVLHHWTALQATEADGTLLPDVVSGQLRRPARVHEPKIKGVAGAQSAGALIVSFNDTAYESYGKEQGDNAPISEDTVFKYANALNYLLGPGGRRALLGDMTLTYWAERASVLETVVSDLLGGPVDSPAGSEDASRVAEARLLLSQVRRGVGTSSAINPDSETGFYILGLSPNAARISVRLWLDTTEGQLASRLAEYLDDVDLYKAGEEPPPLSVRRMVLASGRAVESSPRFTRYDADTVSPSLAGSLTRAILEGAVIPLAALQTIVRRLRTDGAASHERFALIKACINRYARTHGSPGELTVALDTSRSDSPYVTGRLFALLEKAQEDSSGGNLNATIKDRYFASAATTPAVVFARLLKLSQHHLAKLEDGHRIWYERQITDVMSRLEAFASSYGLVDQGLFAIGYYHQRQQLFTKRNNNTDNGGTA